MKSLSFYKSFSKNALSCDCHEDGIFSPFSPFLTPSFHPKSLALLRPYAPLPIPYCLPFVQPHSPTSTSTCLVVVVVSEDALHHTTPPDFKPLRISSLAANLERLLSSLFYLYLLRYTGLHWLPPAAAWPSKGKKKVCPCVFSHRLLLSASHPFTSTRTIQHPLRRRGGSYSCTNVEVPCLNSVAIQSSPSLYIPRQMIGYHWIPASPPGAPSLLPTS